ncbi:HNH endonuclease [Sphingomonas histidinilytica]|uniref:HNH endonuclease n=1 Tax=Rhizorhabdus histidinilytica TaxID=439228 RepID=UPI002E2B80CE|nr:HNH endonuclease signature motif containing protein [Rhizorhabdus histidinilytica]MBO9377901.1 HNH endonuclease [Rhizorhabdus histidinilytica]
MTRRPSGWSRTKSRQERGYGAAWDRTRKRILQRDKHLCQPCLKRGVVRPGPEVDHVTPKAEGGTEDDDNLQAICSDCHKRKTAEEAARAQGRRAPRRIVAVGLDGWPKES